MASRRELLIAALLCVAGSGLAVLAGGRTWARVSGPPSIVAAEPLALTGGALSAAPTLAWVGLAGLAALFAT
ncbi:MAG: MFS transporter, partial [Streptosporangiaceae bacterium]